LFLQVGDGDNKRQRDAHGSVAGLVQEIDGLRDQLLFASQWRSVPLKNTSQPN
jgi:hypothetical protein